MLNTIAKAQAIYVHIFPMLFFARCSICHSLSPFPGFAAHAWASLARSTQKKNRVALFQACQSVT